MSKIKTYLIITFVMLIFCSCSSVVKLAKENEHAMVEIFSPTKAALFVAYENAVEEANLENHTKTANYLYHKYGPATDKFLIGRTNAQTFNFSNKKDRWYIDVNKLKQPYAMIVFEGCHKPQIEYDINKYEKKIEKYINPHPEEIDDAANDKSIETFFLQSDLTTNASSFEDDSLAANSLEKNHYEILFYVKSIGEDKTDAANSTKTYEVELHKVNLNLSERLKESEDFTRRVMYRYDWVQPEVNSEGQVISIENKQELKDTWQEMKNAVQSFYTGAVVDNYLEELGSEFETDQPVYPSFSQYLFFGLLFPDIPATHGATWERKRIIELSPYEDEKFEEQAVYAGTTKGKRRYDIKGSLLPDSQAKLETFEGYMIVPENQTFPTKVEINVSMKTGKIIVQWHFNLEKH